MNTVSANLPMPDAAKVAGARSMSVDQLATALCQPNRDAAALVAALPPGLVIPPSIQDDPVALIRVLQATAHQAPVYRVYLIEKVLMVAPDLGSVSPDVGLIELGLNSMDAVAVLTTVEGELGIEIPLDSIPKGSSVDDLSLWLALQSALREVD